MGRISQVSIYESRGKVRDALLGIIANAYSLVTNLDSSGGQVEIEDLLVEEPSYEGDALRIILNGRLNGVRLQRLITLELTGDSAVHVVADYRQGEPGLQKYVQGILEQLRPNIIEPNVSLEGQAGEGENKSEPLPAPITDPTDQRIYKWIQEDRSVCDSMLAQRLGITRQAVNARRRALAKMGYVVRGVSRQNR